MRQLTFKGYTKTYVSQLSSSGSTAIFALTREAASTNPRLKEPLYLYAASNGNIKTLLSASKNTHLFELYENMSEKFPYDSLIQALEMNSQQLDERYHKVWRSYQSVSKKHERDNRVKELIRRRIVSIQNMQNISTYRICKDLSLNNANINSWLKNGVSHKVSIDTARLILEYTEHL